MADTPSAASPRPFSVDPDVMGRIRALRYWDAERIAELHHAAMGNSLWAKLGKGFLLNLYRALADSPHFLGFVYEEDGQIGGFIAGSTDPDAMMSEALHRAWLPLAMAAAPALMRPGVLLKLAQTREYTRVSGAVDLPAAVVAESLFCSFEKGLRGKRISGHINKVLFDELAWRGHTHVKITTETDNQGANRQLRSWGFVDCGQFRFYGKQMVTYVLDLGASDRVEPTSRHPRL